MSDFLSITLIAAVIVLVIVGRVFLGRFDRERICKQIESHGGKILDIYWNPFATGWRGLRNARLYEVSYRTHRGRP